MNEKTLKSYSVEESQFFQSQVILSIQFFHTPFKDKYRIAKQTEIFKNFMSLDNKESSDKSTGRCSSPMISRVGFVKRRFE